MTAPEPVAEMREQAAQAIEDEAHEHPGAEFHYSVGAGVVRALPLPAPVERVDLDAIEARARAATPGEWWQGDTEDEPRGESDCVYTNEMRIVGPLASEANAAHIAGMDPGTTLRLVAELRGTLAERDASQRGAAEAYAEQMVAYNECARERDVWRDRAERRSQNYTDLGEAMGADPLDSHDGRVEMARLGRVARAEARDLRAVVAAAKREVVACYDAEDRPTLNATIDRISATLGRVEVLPAALSRVPAESPFAHRVLLSDGVGACEVCGVPARFRGTSREVEYQRAGVWTTMPGPCGVPAESPEPTPDGIRRDRLGRCADCLRLAPEGHDPAAICAAFAKMGALDLPSPEPTPEEMADAAGLDGAAGSAVLFAAGVVAERARRGDA